jgi:hypothetical protein
MYIIHDIVYTCSTVTWILHDWHNYTKSVCIWISYRISCKKYIHDSLYTRYIIIWFKLRNYVVTDLSNTHQLNLKQNLGHMPFKFIIEWIIICEKPRQPGPESRYPDGPRAAHSHPESWGTAALSATEGPPDPKQVDHCVDQRLQNCEHRQCQVTTISKYSHGVVIKSHHSLRTVAWGTILLFG